MGAFIVFFDKPWVLYLGVSTYMTSIKEEFHSLSFMDSIPLINIADGISSTVSGK